MAGLSRQSASMPTIKCSNCGNRVEISKMGEHVCGGGSDPATSEPVPPMPDLLGGAFSSLKQSVFDKFTRAPPTVDTSAANRAFARQDQSTPVSASTGSLAISPKTPMNGRPGASSSNDDYFSPVIAGSPRRPGGYGGFSTEPEPYDGDATYGISPNKQVTSLLTRMNTIVPGPFEVGRKQSGRNAFPRTVSRAGTMDSSDDASRTSRLGSSIDRPGTAASGSSAASGSLPPPKRPQREGEDIEPQPLATGKRSETFPDHFLKAGDNEVKIEPPVRVPSAPGLRPDRLSKPSIMNGGRRPSYGIRDTSRPPPPRKSLIQPAAQDGSQNLSINLADEFGSGNPYHSPSISQSSSNSGFSQKTQASQTSQTSANTSPARSVASGVEVRRPSDTSGIVALTDNLQNTLQPVSVMPELKPMPLPRGDGLKPDAAQRATSKSLRIDPTTPAGQDTRLESPVSPGTVPAMARLNTPAQDGQARVRSETTSTMDSASHSRQPTKNPPRSRGNCKACQEPITGKSVTSADGRLTGRYHKACFVCATCKESFSSSTTYVHEDRPYCEQHYHKLNGSLCGSCNRGIEGEYLEDEVPQKYHPGCFRCGDCRVVLLDGYFDVNGKSYCERDAWRRMQSAGRAQQMGPPPPQQQQQRQGSASGPSMRGPPPGGIPSIREPPRGLPVAPSSNLHRPFGLPTGQRLMPGQALGRGGLRPTQRMEKRMTRLGMM